MQFSPIFGTRKTTSTGDESSSDGLPRRIKRKVKRKRGRKFDFGREVIRDKTIDEVVFFSKFLGQGQFGRVLLGVCKKTNMRVAYKEMKIVRDTPSNVEKIANEINVMRKVNTLRSENLVRLISVVERPQLIYIIMEALDGGELFYRIQQKNEQKTKYSESDAANFLNVIAGAVKCLHDSDIVHRDLKPENLIFRTKAEDSDLVIIDFGLAWDMGTGGSDPYARRAVGTPGYLAPEFIQAHKESFRVTKACDIFSLGVILYILLVGFPPFTLSTYKSNKSRAIATAKMYKNMLNEKYEFNKWGWRYISSEAKNLVKSMLRGNPEDRPSIDQVLSHRWIVARNRERRNRRVLNNTIKQIRKFNVCRKWRKAVRAIVMMNRLQSLISSEPSSRRSSFDEEEDHEISLSSSSSSAAAALSTKTTTTKKMKKRQRFE